MCIYFTNKTSNNRRKKLSIYSNQSARKLSQFAESAMAVNRVILQQFSMQLNYLNKERSNIYQPSAKTQQQQQLPLKQHQQHQHHSSSNDSFLMPDLPPPARQFSSSDDDDIHYASESSSRGSHPTTPSEQSSDEDIQTILDNVLSDTNITGSGMNNIIKKCDDVESPLQSRRRRQQLYIVCPTPSG